MASIRKRNGSYLIVVSMGYDYDGNRRKPRQKTIHPPEGLTPKQLEKWLDEQAVLFERECKDTPQTVDKSITLEAYINIWLRDIAPNKLARSTVVREKQDIDRLLPYLGRYKLTELRPEHFRKFYAELRKTPNQYTGKPLSECTIEGVHACLCGILSDAMEGGFLDHNPAWRTYRYAGKKKEKKIADEETTQKLIAALENESIKYETYFKLIIATGMRRGECCGLKWGDINYQEHTIHIQRNVVKVTGEEIIVKEPKTAAGDRYVYFSPEMGSLLKEYRKECDWEAEAYENRMLTEADYVFLDEVGDVLAGGLAQPFPFFADPLMQVDGDLSAQVFGGCHSRIPPSSFCNASIPERFSESYYQHYQGMIDKRSESNISTNEAKKATVLSHMGS